MPVGKKASSYRGAYRVPLFNSPVCLSVCVTFVAFTDCESCTRSIFTNKPGIYGSGRVWANALDVFDHMPSRVGGGRPAAVNFVVCFGWGEMFFRDFHEFAFSNSFVDPFSEQPAWTQRRGSDSQPICPPRTRAHLSPPGVRFSVLPPEKFGVSS